MARTVKAGRLTLGSGMPKIAVPVMAADAAEAREQGARLRRTPADLAELRGDYVRQYRDADQMVQVLSNSSNL